MRGEPSCPLDDLMERSLFSGNVNTGDKFLKRQNPTLPLMRGQPSRPPSAVEKLQEFRSCRFA